MKKSNFIEGAFIATIAIFISKFLGIIYVIPFYKIVGDSGGALYGYAYNIYNLFLMISTAGIPLAISKLSSEYNALNQKEYKEYMFIMTKKIIIIFSTFSFLICFIFAPNIAYLIIGNITGGNSLSDITFVIRCVSFALLIVPVLSVSRGFLQGHNYIFPASFSQIIEQIIRIIVIIFGSYITYKILHLNLKISIGVATLGAAIGAISAYIYLRKKVKKVKKENWNIENLNKEEKQNVIKKIISYSIPFIIINIATSLYSSTDMILLIKGLNIVNFDITSIETISSIFTTWGNKLTTIVTSIATGVAISLIPNISKSNTKKDNKDINYLLNKTLQIFLYISIPLSIFISIFSRQIWTIFYGESIYGPIILQYLILVSSMSSLYIMLLNASQGLGKTKLVYISVLIGLFINLSLDVPLIILYNKIGIYPYYGAITSSLIGFSTSVMISLIFLKKNYSLNFKTTFKLIPKISLSIIILIFISIIYRSIINNVNNRIELIALVGFIGIIYIIIFYMFNKKELEDILGNKLKNIFKKRSDR